MSSAEETCVSFENMYLLKTVPGLMPGRDGLLDYRMPSDQTTRTASLVLVQSDTQSNRPSRHQPMVPTAHPGSGLGEAGSRSALHVGWVRATHRCAAPSAHTCGPLGTLYDPPTKEGKALFGSWKVSLVRVQTTKG